MKYIETKCPHCGGDLEIGPDRQAAVCPYCGSRLLIETELPATESEEKSDRIINDVKAEKKRVKLQMKTEKKQLKEELKKRKKRDL